MKAVAFDMDGVLVDSLDLNWEVKKRLFRPYGTEPTKQDFIDIWVNPEECKKGGNTYFAKTKGLSVSADELREKQKGIYLSLLVDRVKLMPHAIETLKLVSKLGLEKCLVSSNYKYNVDLMLGKFGMQNEFSHIITGEQCSRIKPDPEPYKRAVEALKIPASEILVLEDTATGVRSAKEAGCKCIAIPNEFTKECDFSKADLVVSSLSEITKELILGF